MKAAGCGGTANREGGGAVAGKDAMETTMGWKTGKDEGQGYMKKHARVARQQAGEGIGHGCKGRASARKGARAGREGQQRKGEGVARNAE